MNMDINTLIQKATISGNTNSGTETILRHYNENVESIKYKFNTEVELLDSNIKLFDTKIDDNTEQKTAVSNYIFNKYNNKLKSVNIDSEENLEGWINHISIDISKRQKGIENEIIDENSKKNEIVNKIITTFVVDANKDQIKTYFNTHVEENVFKITTKNSNTPKKNSFFENNKHTISILLIEVILLAIKIYTLYTGTSGADLNVAILSGCLGLIVIGISAWLFKLDGTKTNNFFYGMSFFLWFLLLIEPVLKPISFDILKDKMVNGLYEYNMFYIVLIFILFIVLIVVSKVLQNNNKPIAVKSGNLLEINQEIKIELDNLIKSFINHNNEIKSLESELESINNEKNNYNNLKNQLESIINSKKIELNNLFIQINENKRTLNNLFNELNKLFDDIKKDTDMFCRGVNTSNTFNKEHFIKEYKLESIYNKFK